MPPDEPYEQVAGGQQEPTERPRRYNQARMPEEDSQGKGRKAKYENRASASLQQVAAGPPTSRDDGGTRGRAVSHAFISDPEPERLRRKVSSAELAYLFRMSDNEPAQHSPNYGGWASFEVEIRARRYARCVQAAQAALHAGKIEEAKDWIAEGRVVSFAAPDSMSWNGTFLLDQSPVVPGFLSPRMRSRATHMSRS